MRVPVGEEELASGLHWEVVDGEGDGTRRPTDGVELVSGPLATALAHSTTFTDDEWLSFDVDVYLTHSHFVQAIDGRFYRPVVHEEAARGAASADDANDGDGEPPAAGGAHATSHASARVGTAEIELAEIPDRPRKAYPTMGAASGGVASGGAVSGSISCYPTMTRKDHV